VKVKSMSQRMVWRNFSLILGLSPLVAMVKYLGIIIAPTHGFGQRQKGATILSHD
jgi:hypothetical protein